MAKKWTRSNTMKIHHRQNFEQDILCLSMINSYISTEDGTQFNIRFFIVIKYNNETQEWSSTNMQIETFPVWNHCGLDFESGPRVEIFLFWRVI